MIKRVDATLKWNGNDCIVKGKKTSAKSVFEYGIVVESQAAALCPVQTGRLRGSITTQTKDQEHHGTGIGFILSNSDIIPKPTDEDPNREVATVGTNVNYGPAVEYKRPYMRPAIDLTQGKSLTIFEKNGKNEFKEYFKEKV